MLAVRSVCRPASRALRRLAAAQRAVVSLHLRSEPCTVSVTGDSSHARRPLLPSMRHFGASSTACRAAEAAQARAPPSSAAPAFELEHAPSGTRLTASADGRGLLVSSGLDADEPAVQVSYAWLLDTDQSARGIHPTTSQKYLHSSDAIDAVDAAGEHVLHAQHPPRIDGDTLVLTLAPDVQLSNAFSRIFCAPEGGVARQQPQAPELREVHVPIALLTAHTSAAGYDAWHGDVLGLARPWEARTLRGAAGVGDGSGPLLMDWADIGLAQDELDAHLADTMIPLPDAASAAPRLRAMHALASTLLRDGLAFVTSVPTDTTGSVPFSASPSAGSSSGSGSGAKVAALYHLARLLGEVRATFYGPALWDVRSMRASKNVAYTNADLGFHADLCYFANPPRFQFLHMLRNQVRGGKSLFVDGFAVAQEMWRHHRAEFIALATIPVSFHYNNDGRYYRFAHPTIELAQPFQGFASASSASYPNVPAGTTPPVAPSAHGSQDAMPRLVAINYSPPFQSPLPMHPSPPLGGAEAAAAGLGADSELFRRALSTFARLTHDARFVHARQMAPGESVVFDNRRVLHSRTGFEWSEDEEAPSTQGAATEGAQVKRWLKGCYVEGDAVWSTYRVLRARMRELEGQ